MTKKPSKWQQPLTPKHLKKRAKRDARKRARLDIKRNHHFIFDYLAEA